MAKEWQNIYLSVCHQVIREAGLMTKRHRQINRSNWIDGRGLANDCPSLQIRDRQKTSRFRQSMNVILISSILFLSKTWNSVSYEIIIPLVPPWPSSRRQPKILETSLLHPPLGILETSPHVSCIHTPRGPKVAKPPKKAFGEAVSLKTRVD